MPSAPGPQDVFLARLQTAAERAVKSYLGLDARIGVDDTDDLVQRVVIRVWKRGDFSDDGPATLETYVATVARNLVTDIWREAHAIRRGRNFQTVSLDSPVRDGKSFSEADRRPASEDGYEGPDPQKLTRAIARFRLTLPPKDRAVFDGLAAEPSLAALARTLDWPVTRVRGARDRVRAQAHDAGLREFLR